MQKKFVVLIEDDWEVMGRGTGNVADLQYLPALAMMNIMERYNARMTFMVDVAHQLVLKRHTHIPDVRVQSRIWDETVLQMKERGFDVQMHIHPQWSNASFKDGLFHVNDQWNLGLHSPEVIEKLVCESIEHLNALLLPQFPDYKVCAYKAGSWGMQPAEKVLPVMARHGIKLIMGAREGLSAPNQQVDYVGLEESRLPYSPAMDDLKKIASEANDLTVIPLQPYAPDLITFARLAIDAIKGKFRSKPRTSYYHSEGVPKSILALNPISDKHNFKLGMRPYRTHLKIGNQPFSYLKASFDQVIRELEQYDLARIPIVIESHTKQYHHHYSHIEKFIEYIATQYDSMVEFGDMTSYCREISETPSLVKTHASA